MPSGESGGKAGKTPTRRGEEMGNCREAGLRKREIEKGRSAKLGLRSEIYCPKQFRSNRVPRRTVG
jgi:hypothetical protein